ncbi:SagB/ThcOx family dehydrogenase [Nocardiopsis xinjiangensis]|uniref:SagB/ThcOx family dehydrogenase n=1 Tax=Nocardiopsis xinjiangensis TaxID=124285 RepID=UPI00034DA962|nr:SagB/ThcOx family dehydrogenase [Nocardiopsis xinjiangensis]
MAEVDTSNLVDVVYQSGIPGPDDPAENFFEASKIYPASIPWDVPGVARLERSAEMRQMSTRSTRRYEGRPVLPLPESAPAQASLESVLASRRSADAFDEREVSAGVLSSLLSRSYGVTGSLGEHSLRPTPSAGALYPLDIYVLPSRVESLRSGGRYHFDPFEHALTDLGDVDGAALREATNAPNISGVPAVQLVISASFWRSRFKYGQRALRFALTEAGHLVQNLLLLATAHGLACRPIGGFFDARLTEVMVDHNGVDDAPVYAVLIGYGSDR